MKKANNLKESFGFAIEGIRYTFLHNLNMRIHILAAFLVILLGYFLKVSIFEAGLLGIMILLVITSEMINTVVEEVVNLITKDYRVEAKIAKDVSAGMVLVTSLVAAAIGVMIFLPHLLRVVGL